MTQIEHFVAGRQAEDREVLARLRRPIPPGVTQSYVETGTFPGQMVLVPYCQGVAVVQGILAAKRRVVALNFDPLLVLMVRAALEPLPARQLDAAVTRLGDSLKQGVPLRRYLEDMYAVTCPACLRPAVADYFVWAREQDAPVAKYLRCPACEWNGRTAVDPEDRARLAKVPTRGMHYHYVLDRVAPHSEGGAQRARLEQLLELYSPRNLYALAELTLKIEGLFPEERLRRCLSVLLLDCLDRCSALTPLPGGAARRQGLRRPRRFLERNVWHTFEEAVTRLQTSTWGTGSRLADTLEAFQTSAVEWEGFVGQGLVRDLPDILQPRSVRLIVTSPPPLDAAKWTLCYFWGAWLLGAGAVAPSRPLLRQRTPDPAWYARVMAGSLRNLASPLHDDGRLVLILTGQPPAVVEALLLAASRAHLGVDSLVQCGADYRLTFRSSPPQLVPGKLSASDAPSQTSLEAEIQQATVQAATETIQARGEPVAWRTLHAAINLRLAEKGLFARALETEGQASSPLDLVAEQVQNGLDDVALVRLPAGKGGEDLWWLATPAGLDAPLCDRVEMAAHQILQDSLALTEDAFADAVYARFPGALTPEASLVTTCLRDLSRELTPGFWQLRTEDLPASREAERQALVEKLLALGKQLGYQAAAWDPFDAAWLESGQVRAVFVVRWHAALSEAVALTERVEAAKPYLVIPGGRAALMSYKLDQNPLWQRTLDETGWRFIKYRHIRQLVAQQEVDEYALRTIVGLDPIVEKERVQLSLF